MIRDWVCSGWSTLPATEMTVRPIGWARNTSTHAATRMEQEAADTIGAVIGS